MKDELIEKLLAKIEQLEKEVAQLKLQAGTHYHYHYSNSYPQYPTYPDVTASLGGQVQGCGPDTLSWNNGNL